MSLRNKFVFWGAIALVLIFMAGHTAANDTNTHNREVNPDRHPVKKVLFIGDSMTGWLAERLNAYGTHNGFEVATVVWDGSTIAKWGATPKLKQLVDKEKPDAIFVSLGMNELFERNPESRLGKSVDNMLAAFGDTPYLWVGPPTWPGKKGGETLNNWLANKLGEGNFYNSTPLSLARQGKSNPHPTRDGIVKWMDKVVEWLPESNSKIHFESLNRPAGNQMSRGKTYIYKKMKETL